MRYFGLIGGVGSEEFRPFYELRNSRRSIMVVDTGSCEAHKLPVLPSETVEEAAHFHLAHRRRQVVIALVQDFAGQFSIEVFKRFGSNLCQHAGNVLRGMRKIFVHNVEKE